MPNWSTSFQLPNVPYEKKLEHCLRILRAQRQELIPLRKEINNCKLQSARWEDVMKHWREKYEKSQGELERIKKENEALKKEKEKLKEEIERMAKTNSRYQVALFDHGNFKHKSEDEEKKEKGGQTGHADTNREKSVDYSKYPRRRIFARTCGKCETPLTRVKSTKQKILVDIVINPKIIQLIIESERQWCGGCKTEVLAKDPQTLPFTEYGINTFMMVMILRFSCHSSMGNIAKVIAVGYGLSLSKSDVSNLLKKAAMYLGKRYEELKKAVRKGQVMYKDETGWLVHGQKAWMWIMATEEATVYFAAESRGKGIAKEMYGDSQADAMTDGLKSYESPIPQDKHLYCWAHILRFAHEETVHDKQDTEASFLRDELIKTYHLKKENPEISKEELKTLLTEKIDSLLALSSKEPSFQKIQNRLRNQKRGLIKAMLVTKDGTNNLAERELRNMAIKRTISNGSDTFRGMETTAIIGSVLQTLSRNKEAPFFPSLTTYLKAGIQEKYPQYLHVAFNDS